MNINRIAISKNTKTKHVTYIMTSSFRILDNHSLYFALNNYTSLDIVIYRRNESDRQNTYFDSFKNQLMASLEQFGPVSIVYDVKDISIKNDIIMDMGYLLEEKNVENYIKLKTPYGFTVIESNVAVPVLVTSNKEEYAARTIRNKIYKNLDDFIDPVLEEYKRSDFENKALLEVKNYVDNKLENYELKNHPEFDYTSSFSPYLKYGIISPIRIIIALSDIPLEKKESFIDELIIRRELAYNFVYYNKNYFEFSHMTYNWAYMSMNAHLYDKREYLYTLDDYINFKTHDIYFNTAMKEMVLLGKMHGYMRMYWCKKIIEWSPNYKYAYDTAIYLNNHYFLDGNTPNGYAGVAWCFGKHDRAWKERAIFGKIRYMNLKGLKRKFDMDGYTTRIEREVLTCTTQNQ